MALMALLIFFVLGWSYYMVASILMKGSIFNNARERLYVRASHGNTFWAFWAKMLECLMCTVTQSALWTLGLSTLVIGFYYKIPSHVVSVAAGRLIELSMVGEFVLSLAAAFAISVAVSGEAWAINLIVVSRNSKLIALRSECREREGELLDRISKLEQNLKSLQEVELDLS